MNRQTLSSFNKYCDNLFCMYVGIAPLLFNVSIGWNDKSASLSGHFKPRGCLDAKIKTLHLRE